MSQRILPTMDNIDTATPTIRGFVKILDPDTGEILVEKTNAINPESLSYAALEAVWFLGWSWYMLKSTRVRNTFVNQEPPWPSKPTGTTPPP